MKDYSNHIGIVGGGIAGLSLGCFLANKDIPSVIFERSAHLREGGAGISLSPNAINLLEQLDLREHLFKEGLFSEKINFLDDEAFITSVDSRVCYISRERLVNILYKKYLELGGKVRFDHEFISFNPTTKVTQFQNGQTYKIWHLAACDGIKSTIRDKYFKSKEAPVYSGYSAWRCIGQNSTKDAYLQLSPRKHLVLYPISKTLSSFVGVIKTSTQQQESWIQEGDIEELKTDIGLMSKHHLATVNSADKFYKWGIYIRPVSNQYCTDSMTLFGDAAHPIVPFLGQGGCLSIEDGYVFSDLLSNANDFKEVQDKYEKIRMPRVKLITRLSKEQAVHNHISNPLLRKARNFIMSKTNIINWQMDKIYNFPEN